MELSCDTENWEEGGGQGGQGGRSMSWGRPRALGSDRWMRRRGRAVGTRNKQGTGDNKPEELCRMSHTLCRISRRVFLNVKLRAILAKMSLTRRLSFVWVKRWSGKAGFWTNLGSAEVGLSRSRPEYPDGETQSSLSNPLLPQSQMLLYQLNIRNNLLLAFSDLLSIMKLPLTMHFCYFNLLNIQYTLWFCSIINFTTKWQ